MSSAEAPRGRSIENLVDMSRYVAGSRPIQEHRAHPDTLQAAEERGVDFTTSICPYPDVRRGHPMNLPARQEMSRNNVLWGGFAWLHDKYLSSTPPDRVTARELQNITRIAIGLPSYLVNRAHNPIAPDQLPVVVGDMTKAAAGIEGAVNALILQERPNQVITGQFLYDYANQPVRALGTEVEPPLFSRNGPEVCSATPDMIIRATDILVGRIQAPPSTELDRFIDASEIDSIKAYTILAADISRQEDIVITTLELIDGRMKRALANIKPNMTRVGELKTDYYRLATTFVSERRAAERTLNILLGRNPDNIVRNQNSL